MGSDIKPESIEIQVGDFVFDAIAAGPADGTGVILLHGFPQTSHSFRRQVVALGEAGFRAVAPDQRGYSPRARPQAVDAYGIEQLVGDVVGVADALGMQRFYVVGHDWGAAVTWGVAALHPDRVLGAVPISVPHPIAFSNALNDPDSGQGAASAYMDVFRTEGSENTFVADDAAILKGVYTGVDPEDAAVYVKALGNAEALRAGLNWYRANDLKVLPPLPPIRVPTLLIWSDGDPYLLRPGIEASGQYVEADYRLEILEGINHWVPELAADKVNQLLLDFFEKQ